MPYYDCGTISSLTKYRCTGVPERGWERKIFKKKHG